MKRLAMILIAMLLLSAPCAASYDGGWALYGTEEVESALPGDARSIVGGMTIKEAEKPAEALEKLWRGFGDNLLSSLRAGAVNAVSVLAIALACSCLSAFFDYGSAPEYVTLAGCLGIAAAAAGGVSSLIGMGSAALGELSDFSKVLLPTLCTAAAASGAMTSAAAKYAATALFLDILITAAKNFIVPLIYAYIAVVTAGAALGGKALRAAGRLIKWLCVTMMTALTAVFTAYLGITGAVTGSADAAAVKAAKTVLSASLPVVGGIVSDAASSVVAGAGILRGAAGAFGAIAVCAICAAPVAALGAELLLYKAAAACAAALPSGRLSELIDGIGDACGMMLGLTGCGAVMLFISVISSARAVTGA